MSAHVEPASGVGAYVSGLNLTDLSSSHVSLLKETLGEYGVLFFRDQSLTPEGHIAFAKHFGAININRFFTPTVGYPEIAEVRKEADQSKNIGEKWHTDHSYDQIPALGSILVARELPDTGGDTIFSSMFASYDGLTDELKERIDGLTATHSSRHVFGEKAYGNSEKNDLVGRLGNTEAATQDAVHPVVIRHPISGKRAIYVNPDFTLRINELSDSDSAALLQILYKHCQDDKNLHRFKWQPGSVAFWDNRATWHMALNDYPGKRRLMHRITVEGDELFAG